jgi:starvation-inducible DNA-binding protein
MPHNYHWNVTGPMFNTLHLMFMQQYTEQWNALDLVAERIRALGFPAPGTYKEFVRLASIEEFEGTPRATQMIERLVGAQEATARTGRSLFAVVEKANDQPTMDLLTQRLDVHEKTAWMLRSLLEEYPADRPRAAAGAPSAPPQTSHRWERHAEAARRCCKKKRSISREASGPLPSVWLPSPLPPAQA